MGLIQEDERTKKTFEDKIMTQTASSVKIYFSRLKTYLHYMGIKLNDQDVKVELNFKHKVQEEMYGLT